MQTNYFTLYTSVKAYYYATMARVKITIILSRFLFFALMMLQCFFLASYPAEYEDTPGWYAVTILFIPAAGFWWLINSSRNKISHVFIFWAVYTWLGLVPMIGIVFGLYGDEKFQSEGFWNPSTLKMTLCITPPLLLLIFHTTIASTEFNFRQVTECSVKATINLYDGIDLLGVLLDENVSTFGISKPFKNPLIAFACISYLLLPVVMAIDYYSFGESRENILWLLYYAIQVVFEMIFLGLRLGLNLRYGLTASIFISKNIIMVIVYTRQMFNVCRCCGSEEETSANEQSEDRAETTPPTTPRVHARIYAAPFPRVFDVLPMRSPSVAPAPSAPPPFNPEMIN